MEPMIKLVKNGLVEIFWANKSLLSAQLLGCVLFLRGGLNNGFN